MPPDTGPGSVLADTDLAKTLYGVAGKFRDLAQKRLEKRRRRFGEFDAAKAVVIAKAKRLDAPVSEIALKFEGLQGQSAGGGSECESNR